MQSYINHFQRPPPNRLVTRKLESENTYDEGAWSDHHWEDTMAKQVEITDRPNHSIQNEACVSPLMQHFNPCNKSGGKIHHFHNSKQEAQEYAIVSFKEI